MQAGLGREEREGGEWKMGRGRGTFKENCHDD